VLIIEKSIAPLQESFFWTALVYLPSTKEQIKGTLKSPWSQQYGPVPGKH